MKFLKSTNSQINHLEMKILTKNTTKTKVPKKDKKILKGKAQIKNMIRKNKKWLLNPFKEANLV
jgi:hypothetical protein